VMPLARLLIEELGSTYVQYSFRSQLVFSCGARPAVNASRQTDFLFLETNCGFGGCPFRLGRNRFRLRTAPRNWRYTLYLDGNKRTGVQAATDIVSCSSATIWLYYWIYGKELAP